MSATAKKLLLLEDDAADARLVEMMLVQVAPNEFQLTHAERLADAKRLLAANKFDAVLCDLSVPDSRGLGTCGQIMAQVPDVPVVVFSTLDDETTAMKAVQKGAEDYLIKGQANGTMVVRSLRYAMERRKNRIANGGSAVPQRGKLLTFVGAKGGAGTSTVAVNVAAALAAQQKRVILVELHPGFSTLSLLLHKTPSETLKGALDLARDELDADALGGKLVTLDSGVRVLFGPQRPSDFQELTADVVIPLLEKLALMAEYVLVDCPSYPSPGTQAAVRAGQYTVVVLEREPASLSCARMHLELVKSWGITQDRVGAMVVNRAPLARPLKLSEMHAFLGCEIIGVMPPAPDECAAAQSVGGSLVTSNTQSLAAEALIEAAARLTAEHVCGMHVD